MRIRAKTVLRLRWIASSVLAAILMYCHLAVAQEPLPSREMLPSNRFLSLDASVQYALANNPQLMALRQQHGIAAAGVVIAKTYPFNPIYQGSLQNAKGKVSQTRFSNSTR